MLESLREEYKVTAKLVRSSAKRRLYVCPWKSGGRVLLTSVHHTCPGGIASRMDDERVYRVACIGGAFMMFDA